MIRYLKNLNELEPDFNELITEQKVDCEDYLEGILNSTVFGFLNEIKNSRYFNEEQRECLKKQFNGSTLSQLSVKAGAYEVVGFSTDHPVKEIVKSIYKEHDVEYGRITSICGILPEESRNKSKQTSEDKLGRAAEYCVKLYLSEHGYIDTNVYKIDLSLDNVENKNVDCEIGIKKITEIFDQGIVDEAKVDHPNISEAETNCMLEVYRKEDFMWKSLLIAIFDSVEMEESAKNKEIKKFIKFSSSVTFQAEMCVQEIGNETNNSLP